MKHGSPRRKPAVTPTPKPESKVETKFIGNAPDLEYLIPEMNYLSAWESPESFARHIQAMDPNKAWARSGWDKGTVFSGTSSMKEAIDLSLHGWKEGVAKIEKVRKIILETNAVVTKPIKYGVAGSYPNVPRAIAGNPMNMRCDDLTASRRRPVITLVSDMSANGYISHETITNRAAVVAAIVDQIEEAGYACEVISLATSIGRRSIFGGGGKPGFKVCVAVTVKQSTQPIDIMKLSFNLGHAGMFRRMIFADLEFEPTCERGLGEGLGGSLELDSKELAEKGYYMLPSVEGVGSLFDTEEKASKEGYTFLIDKLKELGCPAFAGLPDLEIKDAA